MIFTVDTSTINLAENRGLLVHCLADMPICSIVEVESLSGEHHVFIKLGEDEFLYPGEPADEYTTNRLFEFIGGSSDSGYDEAMDVRIVCPRFNSLVEKHLDFMDSLANKPNGAIIGGRFIACDGFYLDSNHAFHPVSPLQVALTMLNSQDFKDYIKKETEE